MTTHVRVWVLAMLAIASAALLTACFGEPVPAIGVTRAELVGVWRSGEPKSTIELALRADGTFEARGWPRNLDCVLAKTDPVVTATSLEDLSWNDVISFGGTWSQWTQVKDVVQLNPTGGECLGMSDPTIFIFHDSTGEHLQMSWYMGTAAPEEDGSDQYFVLDQARR